MMIGKFNRYFAKHGKLTMGFIVLAMLLPLGLLYGPQSGSKGGGLLGGDEVGRIGDHGVSQEQLYAQLYAIELFTYYLPRDNQIDVRPGSRGLRALGGQAFDRLRMLREAEELGLDAVGPDELRQYIHNIPQFQGEDGAFSTDKFADFKTNYLRPRGLTAKKGFDEIARAEIVIQRMRSRATESLTVSQPEVRLEVQDNLLTCDVEIASFKPDPEKAEVPEDEIKAAYDKHKDDKYQVPRQKRYVVAAFSAADYAPKRTKAELEAYYKANKGKYERKLVRASHILLKVAKDAKPKAKAAAKKRLEELRQEALVKKNFAALAKKHSEDEATKDKGGDLGLLRLRDRGALSRAAFPLKDQEISKVVTTEDGLHLVQRLGEEKEAMPFDQVEQLIRLSMQRADDEKAASRLYDQRRETEYQEEQVSASHVLIKLEASDTEELKTKKKKLAETVLALARKGEDFAKLAREHSDDPGSKNKGGDLGFFARGRMVPEFDKAVWALEDGEISELVRSQYGYHIIRRDAVRQFTPFADAKSKLLNEVRRERDDKPGKAARAAATDFSVQSYTALAGPTGGERLAGEEAVAAFRQFSARFAAPHKLVETDWVTAADGIVRTSAGGSLVGAGPDFVSATKRLFRMEPLSEVIGSGKYFFVVCFLERIKPHTPTYEDAKEKIESDLKMLKATATARELCRETSAKIKAELDAAVPFEKAKGKIEFEKVPAFSLKRGPRQHAHKDLILEIAKDAKRNTLSAPRDTIDGAVLIYVAKFNFPKEESYQGAGGSYWGSSVKMLRGYEANSSYAAFLARKLPTTYSPRWQNALTEASKPDNNDAAPR